MTVRTGVLVVAAFLLGFGQAEAQLQPDTVVSLTRVELAYPSWSPDGRRIVYQSNVTGDNEIYVMAEDGSNRRRLTHDPADDITPTFSPDGSRIAFVSDRDGDQDIYLMDLQGEIVDTVTLNDDRDIHPYWSPDGEHIVFNSGPTTEEVEIVEVEVGVPGAPRRLTNNDRFDSYASYSPDGRYLAYVTWLENEDGGSNGEIILADREGRTVRRLTTNSVFDGWPAWSHDSRFVVFASADPERRTFDLKQVDIETGEITVLTRVPGLDARPQVRGDGTAIVFNRESDDVIRIMIMTLS